MGTTPVGDGAVPVRSGFQGWLEAALDPTVCVSGQGVIERVNTRVELLFGYGRGELLGAPIGVLVPALSGDGWARLRDRGTSPAGGGHAGGERLSGRCRGGGSFPVEVNVATVEVDGLVVVVMIRDVSDRVALEQELRESRDRPRQIAENISAAFLLRQLDPPQFLYVSPGFERIFGFDPMASGEDPVAGLRHVHPLDWERFRVEYWQRAAAGVAARLEYRIVRPDGAVRWVVAASAPVLDADGVPYRSAVTVEDITDRKQVEQALVSARAEAEQANAAKNDFLSKMSHELRTPLNAVLGFSQLLSMEELTDDQNDSVQHILRGGRHLLALIDDVMDIAKIEGDRLDVSIEPVLIGELVTETVQLMMPTAAESEVTVRYRPGSLAEGERVLADRRRLRQVLLNLLSNAIKYNKPAGRVDVRCRRSRSRPGVLEVSVTDTGHGIAVQDLPRLFTPFDRLGAASGDIEGTGVGLALSQRLMTSMNGRLHASSQVGQGSTFTATMPLAPHPEPVDDAAAPRDTDRHPPVVPDNGPVSTLLFIEDNSSNVRLMERLVRQRPGWRMVVAGHGHLGLELAAGTRPDLVLLDMHLPDMNGLDVLHHLRADPKTSTIPVVVSSADANPHQIQRVLTAGAHRYLTKPLVVADVLELLDTNRRRSNPPAVR